MRNFHICFEQSRLSIVFAYETETNLHYIWADATLWLVNLTCPLFLRTHPSSFPEHNLRSPLSREKNTALLKSQTVHFGEVVRSEPLKVPDELRCVEQ